MYYSDLLYPDKDFELEKELKNKTLSFLGTEVRSGGWKIVKLKWPWRRQGELCAMSIWNSDRCPDPPIRYINIPNPWPLPALHLTKLFGCEENPKGAAAWLKLVESLHMSGFKTISGVKVFLVSITIHNLNIMYFLLAFLEASLKSTFWHEM